MLEWGRTTAGVATIARDGTPVATARTAAMRGDMHVEIGGARWLFFANQGALVGERSGAELPALCAVRPGRGRNTWDVRADQITYRLERTSRLRSQFVVRRDGTDIAAGTGARRLKRATLDANADIPVEHEVFLLWLIGGDHRSPKGSRGGSTIGPPVPGQQAYGAGGLVDGGGFDGGGFN